MCRIRVIKGDIRLIAFHLCKCKIQYSFCFLRLESFYCELSHFSSFVSVNANRTKVCEKIRDEARMRVRKKEENARQNERVTMSAMNSKTRKRKREREGDREAEGKRTGALSVACVLGASSIEHLLRKCAV